MDRGNGWYIARLFGGRIQVAIRVSKKEKTPFDWQRDAPEFCQPKEAHVRLVSTTRKGNRAATQAVRQSRQDAFHEYMAEADLRPPPASRPVNPHSPAPETPRP